MAEAAAGRRRWHRVVPVPGGGRHASSRTAAVSGPPGMLPRRPVRLALRLRLVTSRGPSYPSRAEAEALPSALHDARCSE